MKDFNKIMLEDIALNYVKTAIHRNYKLHIAFLYNKKGELIGKSTNKVGTRSRGAGYSEYTIHAERAVLKLVGDYTNLKDATLVVIRVGKTGSIKYSKPCHGCECHLSKAIQLYGLKKVYYS